MKIKLMVFFMFGICSMHSQNVIEWINLESATSSNHHVIYQTKNGALLAASEISNVLKLSVDSGISWKDVSSNFKYDPNRKQLHEDDKGNILYTSKDEFFEINKVQILTGSYSIEAYSFSDFFDITTLKNGDLITIDEHSISRDHGGGSIDFDNFDDVSKGRFYTSHGELNYFAYPISSNEFKMIKFDNDLNELDRYQINLSLKILLYHNDIFFSHEKYSLDGGKSWKPYIDDKTFTQIFSSHDNNILFVNSDKLMISSDTLHTFEVVILPYSIQYASMDISGRIAITGDGCSNKHSQIFDPKSQTWNLFSFDNPYFYIENIAAYSGESFISHNCNDIFSYKTSSSSEWKSLNTETSPLHSAIALPNAEYLISSKTCNRYSASFDSIGKTSIAPINPNSYIIKNDILYNFVSSTLLEISSNFNTSSTLFMGTNGKRLADFNVVTSDGNPVMTLGSSDDSPIGIFNLNSGVFSVIENCARDIIEIETAYAKPTLYYIKYDAWKYTFFVQPNSFSKVNKGPIPLGLDINRIQLYTDTYGHVFLYDKSTVYLTRDEGKTWIDITPPLNVNRLINFITVSYDHYIFLGTTGNGLYRSKLPLVISNGIDFTKVEDHNIITPNPAINFIHLNQESIPTKLRELLIYDILGNLIIKVDQNEIDESIEISSLSPSLYTAVLVLANGNTFKTKFVKQ